MTLYGGSRRKLLLEIPRTSRLSESRGEESIDGVDLREGEGGQVRVEGKTGVFSVGLTFILLFRISKDELLDVETSQEERSLEE